MNAIVIGILLATGEALAPRTFYFTVMGEAPVEPDMAVVSFTVSSTASSAKEAYTKAERKVGRIKDELSKAGVKDVIITWLYVSPQYSYDGSQVLGYTVSEYLTADVPDLKKLDKVTETLSGDKEVILYGISYGVLKAEAAISAAFRDATEMAKARGLRMKELAGATEIKPYSLSLTLYVPGSADPYYDYYGLGQANKVRATLYVTYAMIMPGDPPFPESLQASPTLSVSATAEVPTKAAEAVAQLSITATKPTAAEAYAEADKILGNLKKKLGKDVMLSTVSVYTTPEYGYGGTKILAYTVTQTVEARSSNMAKTGEIMDAATTLEGVTLSSMYYENKSSEAEEQKAREEAFKKAKAQAQEIGKLWGLEIGAATNITESVAQPYAGAVYGYGYAEMTRSLEGDASYGSLNTTVTMSVSFEIKR
ncbi:MAG: SIMPL domain-containing protein [candidate division WOR-3 bacterium]